MIRSNKAETNLESVHSHTGVNYNGLKKLNWTQHRQHGDNEHSTNRQNTIKKSSLLMLEMCILKLEICILTNKRCMLSQEMCIGGNSVY